MLSEFECGACQTKFVVALIPNIGKLGLIQHCVACGSKGLKYLGGRDGGEQRKLGPPAKVFETLDKTTPTHQIPSPAVIDCPHCGKILVLEIKSEK